MDSSRSSNSIERFEYDPLPSSTHIRLLRRLPKDSNGRLTFWMHTVNLEYRPSYHCLSYTWGNPHANVAFFQNFQGQNPPKHEEKSYEILVNRKLLSVHKNLYDAMLELPIDCYAQRVSRDYNILNGRLEIHVAAKHNNLGLLWSHLQHGANNSARDDSGKTPAHYAAIYKHLDALKVLVDAGADITIKDNDDKMPIAYARENKHQAVVQYIEECMMAGGVFPRSTSSNSTLSYDEFIWVDALCINQEDIPERNAQVAMMDKIYRQAGYVLAWLGAEDFTTAVGIQAMRKIIAARDGFTKSDIIPYLSLSEPEYQRQQLPFISRPEWDSLAALLARQWFRRVWVIQEAVFATDLILYCGRHDIGFNEISTLCDVLRTKYLKLGYESSHRYIPVNEVATSLEYFHERISALRYERIAVANGWTRADGLPVGQPLLLWNLISATFPFYSSDPRDKVFALAAISKIHPDEQNTFHVDYNLSIEDCYANITIELIHQMKELSVLSWVQDDYFKCVDDSSPKERPALPTWVPDYSRRGTCPFSVNVQTFNVFPHPQQESSRLNLSMLSSSILGLAGVKWDTVQSTSGPKKLKFELDPSWFSLALQLCVTYPTGQRRTEVLWRTLCADQDVRGNHPAPDELHRSFKSFVCALMCGKAEKQLQHGLTLFSGIFQVSERRDPSIRVMYGSLAEAIGRHEIEIRQNTGLNSNWFDYARQSFQNLALLSFTEITPPGQPSWQSHVPTLFEVEKFFKESSTDRATLASIGMEEQDGNQNYFIATGDITDDSNELSTAIWAESLKPFGLAFKRAYTGRRLFVTKKGYLGLGPASLKEGDSIFLLSGGRVPFILRLAAAEHQQLQTQRAFHLIGEAYIHGIMHGEAFASQDHQENLEDIFLL